MPKFELDAQGRPIYKATPGRPSRFPKGVSGNLKGRTKGTGNKFSIVSFAKAIKSVEFDKKEQFMIAWLDAAWRNPGAMSDIMNYMLPKLKSVENLNVDFNAAMSDELANSIQQKLRKRYVEKPESK